MRKSNVPVYSVNAQSKSENPLRYVTEVQAKELLSTGKAKRVSKYPFRIQLMTPERVDRDSCTSISFGEMLGNVGLIGNKGFHAMCQAKVAAFAEPSWQDRVVTA
jgi:hypothetical protein